MSAQQAKAIVRLTVENPQRLSDIVKWAELAEGLSFPPGSLVELPTARDQLVVSAYLDVTEAPVEAEQ